MACGRSLGRALARGVAATIANIAESLTICGGFKPLSKQAITVFCGVSRAISSTCPNCGERIWGKTGELFRISAARRRSGWACFSMRNLERYGRALGERSNLSLRRTTPRALKALGASPADIGLGGYPTAVDTTNPVRGGPL